MLIFEVFSHSSLIFFAIYVYLNGYSQRADFWNEACKLADLHHPNVVAFYGVVLDGPGGTFATVTEFMVNGSLRRALQKNDKLVLLCLSYLTVDFVIMLSKCCRL